ncbi:MAG: cysC [Daejeonella sp.]|nr:cysC [Daejeonella sp.]
MIINKLPRQNGLVIWLFGLSGAGKSTIAALLEEMLTERGLFSMTLDGDVLRERINIDLNFTEEDRAENVRRTAEMANLMCKSNVITICSLITPLNSHRMIASDILKEKYFEVFVDCSIEVCAQRDVKGFYKKALLSKIKNFTGISSAFERPNQTGMILSADLNTAEECAKILFNSVIDQVENPECIIADLKPSKITSYPAYKTSIQ